METGLARGLDKVLHETSAGARMSHYSDFLRIGRLWSVTRGVRLSLGDSKSTDFVDGQLLQLDPPAIDRHNVRAVNHTATTATEIAIIS